MDLRNNTALLSFACREKRIRPRPTYKRLKRQQPSFESPARFIVGGLTGDSKGGFFYTLMDQSLDYYRQLAETNPDIAVLVAMIDRLTDELTSTIAAAIKP